MLKKHVYLKNKKLCYLSGWVGGWVGFIDGETSQIQEQHFKNTITSPQGLNTPHTNTV